VCCEDEWVVWGMAAERTIVEIADEDHKSGGSKVTVQLPSQTHDAEAATHSKRSEPSSAVLPHGRSPVSCMCMLVADAISVADPSSPSQH